MVAVGQRDEAGLSGSAAIAPIVKAHLDRHFDRGGAVVGEETAGQSGRRQCNQLFGQAYRGFVGEAGKDDVFQQVELVVQSRIDAWIRVTEQIHPPGAYRVEVPLAVEVLEPHAFAAPDRYRREGFMVLHLGAGVPQDE